jgi:hypothetical protein
MQDGAFNDLHMWKYSKLPLIFNGGWGCAVKTEGELEAALQKARERNNELALIEIQIDSGDCSDTSITSTSDVLLPQYGHLSFTPESTVWHFSQIQPLILYPERLSFGMLSIAPLCSACTVISSLPDPVSMTTAAIFFSAEAKG